MLGSALREEMRQSVDTECVSSMAFYATTSMHTMATVGRTEVNASVKPDSESYLAAARRS